MGWKPGNNIQHDLGEIPHKGQVSEQSLNKMRENAPNRDEWQAEQAYLSHQEELLEDILSSNVNSEEILEKITQAQEQQKLGVGITVFEPDFTQKVETFVEENLPNQDVDDVIEIWYKKELRPDMFYFAFDLDGKRTAETAFSSSTPPLVITPIILWENEKVWCDQGLANYIIPAWVSASYESVYDVSDKTPAQARRELLKLGFVENHDIIA